MLETTIYFGIPENEPRLGILLAHALMPETRRPRAGPMARDAVRPHGPVGGVKVGVINVRMRCPAYRGKAMEP